MCFLHARYSRQFGNTKSEDGAFDSLWGCSKNSGQWLHLGFSFPKGSCPHFDEIKPVGVSQVVCWVTDFYFTYAYIPITQDRVHIHVLYIFCIVAVMRSQTLFKTATIAVTHTICPGIRYTYYICSEHFIVIEFEVTYICGCILPRSSIFGTDLRRCIFQKLLLAWIFSCMNKNAFLSRRRIPLATLLYEHFIHLT